MLLQVSNDEHGITLTLAKTTGVIFSFHLIYEGKMKGPLHADTFPEGFYLAFMKHTVVMCKRHCHCLYHLL